MNFYFQDPTIPYSYSLHEALLQSCSGAQHGGGAYAFVSQDGVKLLLEDDTFKAFVKTGSFNLIVGIDQITNENALIKLRGLRDEYDGLQIRAFLHNVSGSLFHPKFTWFRNKHGGILVVGSGNLTASGLRKNWEAFNVVQVDKKIIKKVENDWNQWLKYSEGNLKSLDDELVLEKARSNLRASYKKKTKKKAESQAEVLREQNWTAGVVSEDIDAWDFVNEDEVLVAEIPKGSTRWNQANFDKYNFEKFFGADPKKKGYIILLRNVQNSGLLGEIESRPSVSVKSKNYRFELEAAAGLDYPSGANRPIGVFICVSVRMFLYVLAMPTDPFYNTINQFLDQNWEGRTDRMKRINSTVGTLRQSCSDLPFWNIVKL